MADKSELLNNYHILIAEDTGYNQLVLHDTLLDWNSTLKIDVAENGEIAIEKIQKAVYNLILIDIQMPIMDGYEATKFIRNELPAPFSEIPIIAITAHSNKDEERYCLEIGMNGYITKPFEPEHLFNAILEVLNFKIKEKFILNNSEETKNAVLPLVNISTIVKYTNGNAERINKIGNLFLIDTPNELMKVKRLYNNQNYTALGLVCHSLKTRYAYMGMPELHLILQEIESCTKNNIDKQKIAELIDRLLSKTEIAYVEIKKMLVN